jgi:hypothetical protein
MPVLNPFVYGKPVPPGRFVGRQEAVRTVFSRLHNGESTAVVGEPHIGKSSLLKYAADEAVRTRWLGDACERQLLIEIDCHLLPGDFTPADFWRQALEPVPFVVTDAAVERQWATVEANDFGSFSLHRLFRLLAAAGWRVALVIDEFDLLLYHPTLRRAEFFGALRSLVVGTDGLSLVTASRLPLAALNRLTQELNQGGSPFFNMSTEVRLLPLSPDERRQLIDTALAEAGLVFGLADHLFVGELAGGHPFLVQVAAASLFDAAVAGGPPAERYDLAAAIFQERAAAHFDDFWAHLDPMAQTALVILALAELSGHLDGRVFDLGDLGQLEWYGPELERLERAGLVEQVAAAAGTIGPTRWEETGWRIGARGFIAWVADNAVASTRRTIAFEEWLAATERDGLLTSEQSATARTWVRRIPQGLITGAAQAAKLLLAESLRPHVTREG